LVLLSGCATPNPNPGERTADVNWENGNYVEAVKVARVEAEYGAPWAQLRMGMYYEAGAGVQTDLPQAVEWYKKAARQLAEGKWAEGYIVGAIGKPGYFGQRYDALIARYRLAEIYFNGEGINHDPLLAYLLVTNVITESKGESQLFFCCEWSRSRWFRQTQFTELKTKLEGVMSQDMIAKAREMAVSWDPKNDL
jgi:hypothetical protein